MKSLLVDAIRQANSDDSDADHALSDSGSFDALNEEFEATANDEPADETVDPDAGLSLMETNTALELPLDGVDPPGDIEEEAAEESLPGYVVDEPADVTAAEERLRQTIEDVLLETAAEKQLRQTMVDELLETKADEELAQTTELTVLEPDTSHAVTVVGDLPRPVPPQKAPVLARLAPLLCVAVMVAVGGAWMLYQKYGIAHGAFGSSALIAQTRAAHTPGIPETASEEAATSRFPFLTSETDNDVERIVQ